MVNTVSSQLPFDPKAVNKNPVPPGSDQGGNKPAITNQAMDTVTIKQGQDATITYTNSVASEGMVDKGYELLSRLVTNMLKEQGIDYEIATGSSTIDISEISHEEAQSLIAEDGYFGIELTSDRIVDFAIAVAGGDVSKLDVIKQGVETGFNEALELFGGSLPEISFDTFNAVMQKLDSWAAEAGAEKA